VKQGQTTAAAESYLKKATGYVWSFAFDVKQLKRLLKSLIANKFVVAKRGSLLQAHDLPKFFDLLLLDAVMAKVHISFDKLLVVKTPTTTVSSSAATTPDSEDARNDLDHAGVDAVQVRRGSDVECCRGCQIFLGAIYQNEEKYTKLPQNR
jgi:hypothetical protein